MDPNSLDVGDVINRSQEKGLFWPEYAWWKAYQDPQLDTLVARTTQGNPSLKIARSRVQRALLQSDDAQSSLYPRLDASSLFRRERFTENQFYRAPYAGNVYWNNQISTDLNYNLDFWGKNRSAYAASLDAVQIAAAEQKEVELSLQTAVVRTYVRLSLDYFLRDIAQQTLDQRREIFSITKRKLDAGLATEIERSQAETPLPAARGTLVKIEADIELARNQLSALTGKGPGGGALIKRPQITFQEHIGLPSIIPADLIARRPDVVANKWMIEAQGEQIRQAKAAFYPDINLRAFLGWQSIGFAQLLNNSSLVYGLAPAIHLPIFDGGHLQSQLGVAHSEYNIAVETYNQSLLHALEQISSQLVALQSLERQRTEALQAKELAEHAYAIALKGYRAGLTNYLSVLNAQEQTLVQTNHCAQIEAQYLDAYALLMQALGGGVQEASSQANS